MPGNTLNLNEAVERLGNVRWDVERFVKNGLPRIMSTALNDAIKQARIEGSRLIRGRYDLKAAMVNGRFKVSKSSFKRLKAKYYYSKRRTSTHLSEFKARQLKGRVRVGILKGQPASDFKHAFLGKGKNSGKPIIFERSPNISGLKRTKENHFLTALYGPSVSSFLQRDDTDARLREVAESRYYDRLTGIAEAAISRALQGRGR